MSTAPKRTPLVHALVVAVGVCAALAEALTGYHTGTRDNAVMTAMAKPLTEKEIRDLAGYFSKQQGLIIKPSHGPMAQDSSPVSRNASAESLPSFEV